MLDGVDVEAVAFNCRRAGAVPFYTADLAPSRQELALWIRGNQTF
jgi:hypothetical protein